MTSLRPWMHVIYRATLAHGSIESASLCGTMYPMNQWGNVGTPGYGVYQQPQMTGQMPMNMQGTGMPGTPFIARPPPPSSNMMPQMTGSMMAQPMGAPPMMQQNATGLSSMMPQNTGMSPMMQQRPAGMTPMMGQPTGMSPMMSQSTGIPMAAQMTGVFSDPRMRLMYTQFLPAAQPYSGVPVPSNMNFNQASLQPEQFQNKLQTMATQQSSKSKAAIPWTMSKEERKSYDNIFRAWDAKKTGWISGEVARELFGQSGLSREQLLQIWHLADSENRGKLNIAEFHIAMALIYRALNGNDIPQELPPELIPSSTRDLSDSVDFLKDLLKQDTSVRNATALNLAEPGSNKDAKYTETRSFYRNPVEREEGRPNDAVAYKHQESESAGYRSRSRYLDRRDVQFNGQSAAQDLDDMKRQLEKTQRMLEGTHLNEEEDHDLQNEMEDVRYAIRRLQDDIEYYNRREGVHAGEQRRKAERTLMQLLYERLPQLEQRLDRRRAKDNEKDLEASRQRDSRNNDKYAHLHVSSPSTPPVSTPEPPTPEPSATRPAPAPSAPSAPKLTGAEREAWIRAEAQRRVQERMRMLGVGGTVDKTPSVDASVEQRLAMEKSEAEARTRQAEEEAKAREEARKTRLREHKQPPPPPTRARPSEQAKPVTTEPSSMSETAPGSHLAAPPSVPSEEKEPFAPSSHPHESDLEAERGLAAEQVPRPSFPSPMRESAPAAPTFPVPALAPAPAPAPARSNTSTNPFFRTASRNYPAEPETVPSASVETPPPSESKWEPEPSTQAEQLPAPSAKTVPLPQAQRTVPSVGTTTRSVHLPPSHDEDWENEEEDDDGFPLSSRATRQHLAQQLFSGVVPTTPSAPAAPPPPPPMPASQPSLGMDGEKVSASTDAERPSQGLSVPLGGGGGDRNALLSQIRGGAALKKTTTRDRSGALTAGTVLGSSSPPPGVSTSSAQVVESSDDEPEDPEPMAVPGGFHASEPAAVPDTADFVNEPPMQDVASVNTTEEITDPGLLGFDTKRSIHGRTLYAFSGDEGVLSFDENRILLIHPRIEGAPIEGDWTYGSLLSAPDVKGLIPTAYIALVDSVVAAEALYDYEAASPEEATIHQGELLQVVDQSDDNWWLIMQNDKCLLVPTNYVAVA
ncbi:hypothetical protein MNAN1_000109 [Malassezia nana]|uniref:Actin cytoskeleton-regulatory complex protein PAN1 n=1 Tax=Malassezia nana TaxID=180528 RepID=A0AAF0EIB9_9BASI|nr:hypothetical protein MNAN1_000109 [Malassezia nana]